MRLFISGEGRVRGGTWRTYRPLPAAQPYDGYLSIERVKGSGFSVAQFPAWLHDEPNAAPGWSFAECIKHKKSWQGVETFIRQRFKLDGVILTAEQVRDEAWRMEIHDLTHQLAEAKGIIEWASKVIAENIPATAPDHTGRNQWLKRAWTFLKPAEKEVCP